MKTRDELHGHDLGPPHTQPELFSLCEQAPGGARPDPLFAMSGPQELVQRRTVQQIIDFVTSLQTLDDPVPQMVEQLPDLLHFFNVLSPGYRSAQDLARCCPCANVGSRAADGRTAGGSSVGLPGKRFPPSCAADG